MFYVLIIIFFFVSSSIMRGKVFGNLEFGREVSKTLSDKWITKRDKLSRTCFNPNRHMIQIAWPSHYKGETDISMLMVYK